MISVTIEKKDPMAMAQDFLKRMGDIDLGSVDDASLAELQKISKLIKGEMSDNPSPMVLGQLATKGMALLDKCCPTESKTETPESEDTSSESPEKPEMSMEDMGKGKEYCAMDALNEIKQMLMDIKSRVK